MSKRIASRASEVFCTCNLTLRLVAFSTSSRASYPRGAPSAIINQSASTPTAPASLPRSQSSPPTQASQRKRRDASYRAEPGKLLSYARAQKPVDPNAPPARTHYAPPVIPRHRRVRINLDRIRSLSGFEKLELLRDFLQAKQVEDAVYVYTVLKENELVARLKYQDYHHLFHLLLADPVTYRDVMLDALSNLRRFGYSPTTSLLTSLLTCCVKWRDLDLAERAYAEMRERKLHVDVTAYNALLGLYASGSKSGVKTQLQRGADLWRDMRAEHAPVNLESRIKAMDILGRLARVDALSALHKEAVTDLLSNRPSPGPLKSTPPRLALDNAYLASLVAASAHDHARAYFDARFAPAWLSGEGLAFSKALQDTFNILMKSCVATRNADEAERHWSQFVSRGLRPDVISYGRLILLSGVTGRTDRARELFEEARERCPGADKEGGKKLMQLRCSLLQAYAEAGNVTLARKVFEEVRADCERAGKPVLRSAVSAMVLADLKVKNLSGALDTWEKARPVSLREGAEEAETVAEEGSAEEPETRGLTRADIVAQFQKLHPDTTA
ncbi:hypothetical protein HKX48_006505 [Thoreauomyces humboldtii]|nr:hypothetical protein HKX48_006505 [Thoreauomyces humboldtii]